jgi:hypothetical protein
MHLRWILLVPLLCASSALGDDVASNIWRNRYEANAIAGWQRLQQPLSLVFGSATRTVKIASKNPADPAYKIPKVRNVEERFWIQDGSAKLSYDMRDYSGAKVSAVIGMNPDYVFLARQPDGGGSYYVKTCGRGQQAIDETKMRLDAFGLADLRRPYGIDSDRRSLAEIFKSQGFELLSCKEITSAGRKLVELHFNFKPDGTSPKQDPSIRRSIIVLDPDADWRLVKSATTCNQTVSELELSYSTDFGRHADVTGLVRRIHEGMGEYTERVVYSGLSHSPIATSEFYLPALGLPDCPGLPQGPLRRMTFIGGGLMGLGGILYLAYRHRGLRSRSA